MPYRVGHRFQCIFLLFYYNMKLKTKNKIKKKTNKTLKKSNNSCNEFCKNVYIDEVDKQNKEFAKLSKIAYQPRKKDIAFRMSICKKNFCNKDCKNNYTYYDKQSETFFLKNMKNNFITNMRPSVIETTKTKGAISYCDGNVYNPFNRK